MTFDSSSCRVPRKVDRGYTLVELLVVVVIIGVLASVAVIGINSVLRREKLNSVALAMASWFEQVRNQSANEISQADSAGGCTIRFTPSPSGLSKSVIAEVVSAKCSAALVASGIPSQLLVPSAENAAFSIKLFPSGLSSPVDLVFTPRGMTKGPSGNLEYRILLADGGAPKRCVRLADITGTVEIGFSANADLASPCTSYEGL